MNKAVINACYGGFSLSKEAVEWLKQNGKLDAHSYSYRDENNRHDPLLIKCIESLKAQGVSGAYGQLETVEFEGDKYRIDEYDGFESLETPESINWVKIK